MQSELKKTKQYFRSVGTVEELALKLEDCDIKTKDADGNENIVKGERIMGNVSLRTQNGVHTFNVYFQSISYDGSENKRWKMANDMLTWSPAINGNGEPPTLVSIEGTVSINDYPKDGEVHTNLRWAVGKATTKVSADEPTGTTLEATCYVNSIKEEVINEEETGRLKVTLMGANNKGACFPIDIIVDTDLAEDFGELIEVGETHPFTLDLKMKHIGGDEKKGKKKMLGGGGSVAVNNGFDVPELILVGAEEAIEEPDETEDEDGNPIEDKSGYINPAVMKKAIKVRAQMLEELKNNPPEKKSGGKQESFKERKAKASKAIGKTSAKKPPFEDVGLDEDEDF